MVATLDYAFFLHIFPDIIGYCDFETQIKLRLLCSSFKLEVDSLHCQLIDLFFSLNDRNIDAPIPPDSVALCINTKGYSRAPMFCPSARLMKIRARNLKDGIGSAEAFALRHARGVFTWSDDLVWDLFSSAEALRNGTSYSSPFKLLEKATRMTLCLGEVGVLLTDYAGPVTIPTCIRKLTVYVMGEDVILDGKELVHACFLVLLRLGARASPPSPFLLSLLAPCVERLVLAVDNEQAAISYVTSIKLRERQPLLRVVVAITFDLQQEKKHQFLKTLTGLIDADVGTLHYPGLLYKASPEGGDYSKRGCIRRLVEPPPTVSWLSSKPQKTIHNDGMVLKNARKLSNRE